MPEITLTEEEWDALERVGDRLAVSGDHEEVVEIVTAALAAVRQHPDYRRPE